MAIPIAIDREAHTLGAFRPCRHGDAIAYDATLESSGFDTVLAIVTALFAAGHLLDHGCCAVGEQDAGCYAVLDAICVPTEASFDHLRTTLGLRINSSDCDQGCA